MPRTLSFVVACLVLLAGCTVGGPARTETPTAPPGGSTVALNVTNADTVAHTVSVGVVEGSVESVELTLADGGTRTVPAESPETSIFSFADEEVTEVTLAGGQTAVRTYELDPGAIRVEQVSVPSGATLVFVDRTDGRVTALGLARCPPPTTTNSADFLVGGYGPLVGLGCAG
jgi:hypothetical protein